MVTTTSYNVSSPAASGRVSTHQTNLPPWRLPEWFLISQTALPALLYLPGSQSFRLPVRIAAFAISLAALSWYSMQPGRRLPSHASQPWLLAALFYLGIMIVHPTTNTEVAGFAQVMLYLAVAAPVFWLPGFVGGIQHLERLAGILLICNGVNAIVGVLQVYDPAYWMPQDLSQNVIHSTYGVEALSYIGPDGQRIIRPPGLFDTPGAVAGPGTFAGLFGLIFFFKSREFWRKGVALAFALAGMSVICLTQIRTSFVVLSTMVLVCGGLLLNQRQRVQGAAFIGFAGLLGVVAFIYASFLGGDSIKTRYASLFSEDPVSVYYGAKRGYELERAFDKLLIEYPLGAGLGRWGMMRKYFGDPSNLDSPAIWADIQITGWILDGGWIVLGLYGLALVMMFRDGLRLVKSAPDMEVRFWAAVLTATNAGLVIMVFSFPLFISPIGLQFWFLAGALHGAAHKSQMASTP